MDALITELNAHTHIIVWTMISFGIVVTVLWKFGWPQIIKALEEREAGIRNDLDQAKNEREEAARLLEDHKKKLALADQDVRAMLDEAKRDVEVLRQEVESKARTEAEAIKERAMRDISLAKEAALVEIRQQSVQLSSQMAGQILQREINPSDHSQLVDKAIQGLG